ncbi:MAG: hypothetical protein ACLR6J_10115 [Parabacteroides merdae]
MRHLLFICCCYFINGHNEENEISVDPTIMPEATTTWGEYIWLLG